MIARNRLGWLAVGLVLSVGTVGGRAESPADQPAESLPEQRRLFQQLELITARPYTFVFDPGRPPRIVWRDVDEAKRLGGSPLRVRWFDADRNEVEVPGRPGRWGAWIEGTAPNGTPLRRALSFYARPPGFLLYLPEGYAPSFPPQPGPIAPQVWREHAAEVDALAGDAAVRGLNDSAAGVALIAGLAEMRPLGRAPRMPETAAARDAEYHLALKLKLQGLSGRVRPLGPPATRASGQMPVLRGGEPGEAGVRGDAKQRIDAVCRAWAEDSGEPFVTLIARRGVIVTHEAFGRGRDGKPISREYRADVASITKTATAILFMQFVDQELVGLDDPVSTVFPDYPKDDPRVPTFRQCLTHTSGLSGHGEFGAVRNPHFENVVLNAIDVNQPGRQYIYTGTGFELVAKAMEIVSGKAFDRLYHDHLFGPMGMGDVPMRMASSGGHFTAHELGIMAQWLANQGSYGERQFVSPVTFRRMLPEPLSRRYPGIHEIEGIGMHWMAVLRRGSPAGSTRQGDLLLGPRTIGHGSLTRCMLFADLDNALVIVQVRRGAGERFDEWSAKFFEAIVESLVDPRAPATAE